MVAATEVEEKNRPSCRRSMPLALNDGVEAYLDESLKNF